MVPASAVGAAILLEDERTKGSANQTMLERGAHVTLRTLSGLAPYRRIFT